MAAHPLKNYKILIVDADIDLAKVLSLMLDKMGFVNCEHTRSGVDAYRMLSNQPYDFLITEWNVTQINGLDLLKKIRRNPDSPNPTLPAIMLTGRAEQADVCAARDCGINEFVVKPFSAKTVYNRIERIIETPRQFIVSKSFVGPTRRIHRSLLPGMSDRRVHKIQPQLMPKDVHGAMQVQHSPRVWLPDFSLKYKLGTNMKLESLITEAVIEQAQAAVDAISDTSLGWIKTNLAEMRALLDAMLMGEAAATAEAMGEMALTVNSRAGTFGYSRASEIAYLLYLFCRNHFNPASRDHRMIVQKHIDVLQVILGNQMRGSAGEVGDQLITELKKLADKFTS